MFDKILLGALFFQFVAICFLCFLLVVWFKKDEKIRSLLSLRGIKIFLLVFLVVSLYFEWVAIKHHLIPALKILTVVLGFSFSALFTAFVCTEKSRG